MLTALELQQYLNQFEALRGISVTYENDLRASLAPQLVQLTGMVNIQGDPHFFESDINLNDFKSRDDLLRLAGLILQAFDQAGVQKLGT